MSSREVVYLDHAGATLPPPSYLDAVFSDLRDRSKTLSNPHSGHGYSQIVVDEVRSLILNHFHASHSEYDVVFTSGSTAGLKMVGEYFPWTEDSELYYPSNAHTSLLGMRSYAPNASCYYWSHLLDFLDKNKDKNKDEKTGSVCYVDQDDQGEREKDSTQQYSLFAVSGECNFSGERCDLQALSRLVSDLKSGKVKKLPEAIVRHSCSVKNVSNTPKDCIEDEDATSVGKKWLWLLDAAKLVATSDLHVDNLDSNGRPDFIVMSFYKMFGYPTGLGALLVKRDIAPLLLTRKDYFGGGTVDAVASDSMFVVPREEPHEYLEDGTLHYQGIAALRRGFEYWKNALGGVGNLKRTLTALTRQLVEMLKDLVHSDSGLPVCILYGSHHHNDDNGDADGEQDNKYVLNGPVVAFNVTWSDGTLVGFNDVLRRARDKEYRITLRGGCFCNIGACQHHLHMSAEDVEQHFRSGRSCWNSEIDLVEGKYTGALRASLGMGSTLEDCLALACFIKTEYCDRTQDQSVRLRLQDRVPKIEDDNTTTSKGEKMNITSLERKDTVQVDELYVFPIKSCGALRVYKWPLGKSGLFLDREWILVDASGKAVTQKRTPRLATLSVTLKRYLGRVYLQINASIGSVLEGSVLSKLPLILSISREDSDFLLKHSCVTEEMVEANVNEKQRDVFQSNRTEQEIQREKEGEASISSSSCKIQHTLATEVRVCGRPMLGYGNDGEADAWFSDFLGFECHLLRRRSPSTETSTNELINGAKEEEEKKGKAFAKVSTFANEGQLLMVTTASMKSLDDSIAQDNSTQIKSSGDSVNSRINFRPNLVVKSCVPHEEEIWKTLTIEKSPSRNKVQLFVDKPCARCTVVNVDTARGIIDGSTLSMISTYRHQGGGAFFGMFLQYNCDVESGRGVNFLRQGDSFVVAKKSEL